MRRLATTAEEASKTGKPRRAHRKTYCKIFADATPPTTENILVKLMLGAEGHTPSALQRAICRAMDGLSLLSADHHRRLR